jgi:hypothetical protein
MVRTIERVLDIGGGSGLGRVGGGETGGAPAVSTDTINGLVGRGVKEADGQNRVDGFVSKHTGSSSFSSDSE